MAGDAGMMVGPIIIGWLSDLYSYRIAFAASAAVFTVAVFLAIQIPETRQSYLSENPRQSKAPQVNNLRRPDVDR